MREIEFRGKGKYNGNYYFSGDWVYGFYFIDEQENHYIIDSTPDEFGNARFAHVQVVPETVCQYTSRKDRTRTKEYPEGKKIYEGDIVSESGPLGTTVYEVKWSEKHCGFDPFSDYDVDCEEYILSSDCEIIGNIHQNTELSE